MKKISEKLESRIRKNVPIRRKTVRIHSGRHQSQDKTSLVRQIVQSAPFKYNPWFLTPVIFVFFLFIYWKTCCPTIFWWDSAEFVSAVATSGIPHPPSFPLYILLGKVFSFLPFFPLPFKLNLLSGIFSALSLSIFFLLLLKVFRVFFSELAEDKRLIFFSSILVLFVAGLNYAFWIQGVRAEVYSLNGLLFICLLFCGVNFIDGNKDHSKNLRRTCLFFFIFGLGMGNHNVTLISTFPAFIFLFVANGFNDFFKKKNLIFSLLFFCLGFSIYLYLPLRAINSPALDWGNPVDLRRVFTAALALKSVKQIGLTISFTLGERVKDVWQMLYSQFTFLPFILSLAGSFYLLKKHFKLFIFFLVLIIGNLLTIIILPSEFISTSTDFQGYILPAIFSFAFLFGLGVLFGLRSVKEWIGKREFSPGFRRSLVIVFSLFFFSISLLPFFTYNKLADLSGDDLAYRYGKSVLSEAKENAVLILDNPNLYFILSALRYGEGYRKDVAVLDRGLLQAQWNCEQERKNYPQLFSGINPDLRGENLFLALMSKGLSRNLPVYLEFTEKDSEMVDLLTPAEHLFKIEKKILKKLPAAVLARQKDFEDTYFSQTGKDAFKKDADAQRMFVLVTYRWGLYYEQKGMLKEALKNYSSAGELDRFDPEIQSKIERLRNRMRLAKS